MNIVNINQQLMENYFMMFILVDMTQKEESFEEVASCLKQVGEKLALAIHIQHQDAFRVMHRI